MSSLASNNSLGPTQQPHRKPAVLHIPGRELPSAGDRPAPFWMDSSGEFHIAEITTKETSPVNPQFPKWSAENTSFRGMRGRLLERTRRRHQRLSISKAVHMRVADVNYASDEGPLAIKAPTVPEDMQPVTSSQEKQTKRAQKRQLKTLALRRNKNDLLRTFYGSIIDTTGESSSNNPPSYRNQKEMFKERISGIRASRKEVKGALKGHKKFVKSDLKLRKLNSKMDRSIEGNDIPGRVLGARIMAASNSLNNREVAAVSHEIRRSRGQLANQKTVRAVKATGRAGTYWLDGAAHAAGDGTKATSRAVARGGKFWVVSSGHAARDGSRAIVRGIKRAATVVDEKVGLTDNLDASLHYTSAYIQSRAEAEITKRRSKKQK